MTFVPTPVATFMSALAMTDLRIKCFDSQRWSVDLCCTILHHRASGLNWGNFAESGHEEAAIGASVGASCFFLSRVRFVVTIVTAIATFVSSGCFSGYSGLFWLFWFVLIDTVVLVVLVVFWLFLVVVFGSLQQSHCR